MLSLDTKAPPPDAAPVPVKGTTGAAIQAALVSIVLALVTVVGAFGSILAFAKTRDLNGLLQWLRSSEAAMAITAGTTLIGFITIGWRSLKRQVDFIKVARVAPDDKFFIVGEQDPPPPDSRARTENAQPPTRLVSMAEAAGGAGSAHAVGLPDDEDRQVTQAIETELARPPLSLVPTAAVDVPPEKLIPNIPGDALSVPVIDLRTPTKES